MPLSLDHRRAHTQCSSAFVRLQSLRGLPCLAQKPWFEAVALAAGVGRVTTVSFEVIATDHPQLETLTEYAG